MIPTDCSRFTVCSSAIQCLPDHVLRSLRNPVCAYLPSGLRSRRENTKKNYSRAHVRKLRFFFFIFFAIEENFANYFEGWRKDEVVRALEKTFFFCRSVMIFRGVNNGHSKYLRKSACWVFFWIDDNFSKDLRETRKIRSVAYARENFRFSMIDNDFRTIAEELTK